MGVQCPDVGVVARHLRFIVTGFHVNVTPLVVGLTFETVVEVEPIPPSSPSLIVTLIDAVSDDVAVGLSSANEQVIVPEPVATLNAWPVLDPNPHEAAVSEKVSVPGSVVVIV